MNRELFVKEMISKVRGNNPDQNLELDGDSDIVRMGLVDSLKVTDLIVEAEELTGKSIPLDKFDVANFRSFHKLYDSYFAE